jgi:hypothetical protein
MKSKRKTSSLTDLIKAHYALDRAKLYLLRAISKYPKTKTKHAYINKQQS